MVYWEVAEGPPRALAPSSTARSLSSEAKSDGMTDPDWERIASRFGMPEGTAVALGLAPNPQAAPGADDSAARKLQDIVQRAKHALVSYDTLPPEDEHIAAPSADGEVSSMRELMDKMMTDFGRRAKQRERALDNVEVSARDLATASSREAVAHEVERETESEGDGEDDEIGGAERKELVQRGKAIGDQLGERMHGQIRRLGDVHEQGTAMLQAHVKRLEERMEGAEAWRIARAGSVEEALRRADADRQVMLESMAGLEEECVRLKQRQRQGEVASKLRGLVGDSDAAERHTERP